jgi:hypothetical protein
MLKPNASSGHAVNIFLSPLTSKQAPILVPVDTECAANSCYFDRYPIGATPTRLSNHGRRRPQTVQLLMFSAKTNIARAL